MKKSKSELLSLHSGSYVEKYERNHNSRLQRLVEYFDLGLDKKVVDYACGNALLLEVIHERVGEYHGVDFSKEMLDLARQRGARLSACSIFFHNEDIFFFSEKYKNQFDVAFAMDFSEHVYDEDWVRILKAIRETLKVGGLFYLHTPNKRYFIEILKEWGVLKQFPQHIAVRTPVHNSNLLKDAGFKDVKIRMLSHYEKWQKPLFLLRFMPRVGELFEARVFLSAIK